MTKRDRRTAWILYGSVFAVYALMGVVLHVPPVGDEVGTAANTMLLLGHNWAEHLYSYGGFYYKYGMTLLQLPVLALVQDGVLAYKLLMVVNALLVATIPVMAYVILRRYLPAAERPISERTAVLLSVAVAILPEMVLQSLYLRADAALVVFPWVLILLFMGAMQAAEQGEKKRLVRCSVLLGAVSVYAYMCHVRGLVLLIACVMTVFLLSLMYKKPVVSLPAYGLTTAVLLVIDRPLTVFFRNALFPYGVVHGEMGTYDFEYLTRMFTSITGAFSFVKGVAGWLYATFVSTAGLVLLGGIAALLFLWFFLRKKQDVTSAEIGLSVVGLLVACGTLLMGLLFMYGHIDDLYNGTTLEMGDALLYTRYTAGALGPLVLLAFYGFIVRGNLLGWKVKTAWLGVSLAIFGLVAWKIAPIVEKRVLRLHYLMTMNTFLKIEPGQSGGAMPHIALALVLAGGLALAAMLVIWLLLEKKKTTVALLLFIVYCGSLLGVNYVKVRLWRDDLLFECGAAAMEFIEKNRDLAEDYPLIAMPTSTYLKSYQLALREFNTVKLDSDFAQADSDHFIVMPNKANDTVRDDNDEAYELEPGGVYYIIEEYDYSPGAQDVVYVQGEGLRQDLEARGYTLAPYVPVIPHNDE